MHVFEKQNVKVKGEGDLSGSTTKTIFFVCLS